MTAKDKLMGDIDSTSEEPLKDDLINNILIVSAAVAVAALASAIFRALEIGFTYRDIIQSIVVGSIVVLASIRQKLNTYCKALFLIMAYSVGGFSGFYTLGMLGGTIFVFPTAAVVITIFYSVRVTLVYTFLFLLLCCWVAIGFCTNMIRLESSADHLITNYSHWIVYIISVSFFFTVACVTIHKYRKTMKMLIDKVGRQRDELSKTNEALLKALKDVKILSGLLPICSYCKKIRDDNGFWKQLEAYIQEHSQAEFSHSICRDCAKKHYPDMNFYDK